MYYDSIRFAGGDACTILSTCAHLHVCELRVCATTGYMYVDTRVRSDTLCASKKKTACLEVANCSSVTLVCVEIATFDFPFSFLHQLLLQEFLFPVKVFDSKTSLLNVLENKWDGGCSRGNPSRIHFFPIFFWFGFSIEEDLETTLRRTIRKHGDFTHATHVLTLCKHTQHTLSSHMSLTCSTPAGTRNFSVSFLCTKSARSEGTDANPTRPVASTHWSTSSQPNAGVEAHK